jgi:hypothetical protein
VEEDLLGSIADVALAIVTRSVRRNGTPASFDRFHPLGAPPGQTSTTGWNRWISPADEGCPPSLALARVFVGAMR